MDRPTLRATPAGLRLVIFDLDGTLIDSRADLAASVNAMLAAMRRPALDESRVESLVGNGAAVLVRRALEIGATPGAEAPIRGAAGEDDLKTGLELFLAHYERHLLDRTRLYPGIRAALVRLGARYRLAVLSNKPERMSRAILEGLGAAGDFDGIFGGDSFAARKPDPAGMSELMRRAGADPPASVMVGDSGIDIATGRAAGAWTCGVTWGFGAAGFAADPPDWQVDSPAELTALLAGG